MLLKPPSDFFPLLDVVAASKPEPVELHKVEQVTEPCPTSFEKYKNGEMRWASMYKCHRPGGSSTGKDCRCTSYSSSSSLSRGRLLQLFVTVLPPPFSSLLEQECLHVPLQSCHGEQFQMFLKPAQGLHWWKVGEVAGGVALSGGPRTT